MSLYSNVKYIKIWFQWSLKDVKLHLNLICSVLYWFHLDNFFIDLALREHCHLFLYLPSWCWKAFWKATFLLPLAYFHLLFWESHPCITTGQNQTFEEFYSKLKGYNTIFPDVVDSIIFDLPMTALWCRNMLARCIFYFIRGQDEVNSTVLFDAKHHLQNIWNWLF